MNNHDRDFKVWLVVVIGAIIISLGTSLVWANANMHNNDNSVKQLQIVHPQR